MTTAWTVEQVGKLAIGATSTIPVIAGVERKAAVPGLDLWDPWPVRTGQGEVVRFEGSELWVALSAAATGHPGQRHDRARLRLLARSSEGVTDLGVVFPDGASCGSREWAGSTVVDPDGVVTVFYTAAGRRGERAPTFEQRLFQATGRLDAGPDGVRLSGFDRHHESVTADPRWYMEASETHGVPGFIKAFRDPFVFRDPTTGTTHLLFTASLIGAASTFNGAVGHAVADDASLSRWTLRPPLLHADGVNNELERPHIVQHGALTYVFFSTQARTFHPDVSAPTGLYGFVATEIEGPYTPLNGSGLVACNPPDEPTQGYSWLVLDDLSVTSFIDTYALRGRTPDEFEAAGTETVRKHFGGAFAPVLGLELDGDRARLLETDALAAPEVLKGVLKGT